MEQAATFYHVMGESNHHASFHVSPDIIIVVGDEESLQTILVTCNIHGLMYMCGIYICATYACMCLVRCFDSLTCSAYFFSLL